MNLIVPMAGKSSRFPDMRPKWMLTHPSGRFMGIEAVSGLNLESFSRVYFVCLSEHEAKYQFRGGFEEELRELGLGEKASVIMLDRPTRDQPETVYQAIQKGGIEGPIFIKDADNYFRVTAYAGNMACFYDLNECGMIKPGNKSYLTHDEQGFIANIVEKRVISPYFSVGGYGFESAALFCQALDQLVLREERYISHLIFHLVLQGHKFSGVKVANYEDWGTADDWQRTTRSYATVFVDIDGTLVENSSAHFPPYIGNTAVLRANVDALRKLHETGRVQVILTSSRPEKYREITLEQLKRERIPFDQLVLGLFHARRLIVNDYAKSNPYKTCDAINLRRNSDDLNEMLRDSFTVQFT